MKNYAITRPGYQINPNPEYFDDTCFKDQYQNEVYTKALELADDCGGKRILDFGCGSGYKLVKYFPHPEFRTIGIDLKPTVSWLRTTYPEHQWLTEGDVYTKCDVFIASDVIEHLTDPDEVLNAIAVSSPKFAIISTPNRDLIGDMKCQSGPTGKHHVREWNYEEFEKYIGSRFRIHQHYMSNRKNATQVVVLKDPK